MHLYSASILTKDNIANTEYDIKIFCTGFEHRCTFLRRNIDWSNSGETIVFGFDDNNISDARTRNDNIFTTTYESTIDIISGNEDAGIYQKLNSISSSGPNIRIFVDYSSMTRTWYAAILNWCRFQSKFENIVIDFGYAVGEYPTKHKPMVIESIEAILGFEGSALDLNPSVLVFGLGFEGAASMCVLERLEPDIVFTYYAEPAASEMALQRSLELNDELINHHSKANLKLPLENVHAVVQSLSELIRPYLGSGRVTIVPMGPKPHILAALILNIRHPKVTCLRISGRGTKREDVLANGNSVFTSVEFRKHLEPAANFI